MELNPHYPTLLTIITGRAGSGKTAYIMNDIKQKVMSKESGLFLIVPEQYSHDAEKQLCRHCGDTLSMYGEVLSFTQLCRNVLAEVGGASVELLDVGGQILVLYRAIESAAPSLKAYNSRNLRTELLESLLGSIVEFKSFGILPERLNEVTGQSTGPFYDKLHDLSMVYSAYESILHNISPDGDITDKMTLLADQIGDSAVVKANHIYFDGFNDFTIQELSVIEELMHKKVNMTVCLTLDCDDIGEMFELPRKTMQQLKRLADIYNIEIVQKSLKEDEINTPQTDKVEELMFLERHLFDRKLSKFDTTKPSSEAITIYSAPSRYTECEYAAYSVWKLVRSGYRWRDIAVMARDWEKYSSLCENVFEKYEIPFFASGRTEILNKPAIALLDSALEVASFGFESKSIFRLLKTGLADISGTECALVENYVYKWNIRGSMWTSEWTLPARGYFSDENSGDKSDSELKRLNEIRHKVVWPLIRLKDGVKTGTSTVDKLQALYNFTEDIKLPEKLAEKADEFDRSFETRLADEYAQTWNIIKTAMEQMYLIFDSETNSDSSCNAAEFRKLFMLTLSQYDVGAIPASLDRTTLGGMEMNRRRDLKCLILLGATDDDLPKLSKRGGILSDNERSELVKLGIDIPASFQDKLDREMNMIYSTLTLPTEKLILSRPMGEYPSLFVKNIKAMFALEEIILNEEQYLSAAKIPCFELASYSGNTNFSPTAMAAREYFSQLKDMDFGRLKFGDEHQNPSRGRLSPLHVKSLYGSKLSLSASRVDRYYSCPYQYFVHSGLKLKPHKPAEIDAKSVGLFMHYILENVFREISETTDVKNADETFFLDLINQYVEKFVSQTLYDFASKNERFIYLFKRLADNATRIAFDMLDELRSSDFKPLAFELELSTLGAQMGELSLRGTIDRVDGWEDNGNMYLRVVDYKTGKKKLNLTNLVNGRDMQMLIYLFVLQRLGASLYGDNIIPAGVMYIPASDAITDTDRNISTDEIKKNREKEIKRDGLMLNDIKVINAMENTEIKRFLPVKHTKDGMKPGDSFISQKQISLLSKHVDHMLKRAADDISDGNIDCAPYFKGISDNACLYCEYSSVCAFDVEMGDSPRITRTMKNDEAWKCLGYDE